MRRKRSVTKVLCVGAAVIMCCCGCGQDEQISAEGEGTSAEQQGSTGADFKMAMVSSEFGAEAFNLMAYDAMNVAAEKYGFDCISIECTDTSAWEVNC